MEAIDDVDRKVQASSAEMMCPEGAITVEEGLRNADSVNDLRLRLKLESKRAGIDLNDGVELSMEEDPAKSGMLG